MGDFFCCYLPANNSSSFILHHNHSLTYRSTGPQLQPKESQDSVYPPSQWLSNLVSRNHRSLNSLFTFTNLLQATPRTLSTSSPTRLPPLAPTSRRLASTTPTRARSTRLVPKPSRLARISQALLNTMPTRLEPPMPPTRPAMQPRTPRRLSSMRPTKPTSHPRVRRPTSSKLRTWRLVPSRLPARLLVVSNSKSLSDM